jgi:hypothetical protein
MTKRKTALQELIYWIEENMPYDKNIKSIHNVANSLLHKEKQDLIDAFDEGSNATSWDSFEEAYDITPSKQEYFNQTFENER